MFRSRSGGLAHTRVAAACATFATLTATAVTQADGSGTFGPAPATHDAMPLHEASQPVPAPPAPAAPSHPPLPLACRFEVPQGNNAGLWYDRRCLVASYVHWPLLPERCERRVRRPEHRSALVAYAAGCLVQAGYRPDGSGDWPGP